jgi:hypothetical protein
MSQIDTKRLLAILLNSAGMDMMDQCLHCLATFDNYEWQPKAGLSASDTNIFHMLHALGEINALSIEKLNEFMELVDSQGEVHPYYAVYMGNKYLSDS